MKLKLLLCLALVLSGRLFGCSTVQPSGLPLRYHNAQYGLTFFLPADWQGYSILIQQLDDDHFSPAADKTIPVGHAPMITLGHPLWPNAPYQAIPISVFTRTQWDTLHQGKLWPSMFAGGVMDELCGIIKNTCLPCPAATMLTTR